MLPLKRKRRSVKDVALENDSDANSAFSSASSIADADFLGQRGVSNNDKTKFTSKGEDPADEKGTSSEEEEDETALIRKSIAKRNIRDGKELLKKTLKVKGKGKAKADMGGGSFQSMGSYFLPTNSTSSNCL
jgi:ATP-dependent RNA helicase DDX54/DBP10